MPFDVYSQAGADAAFATAAQGAKADTAVQPERLPLNIKDFGATGDGVTDDTDAFDDALAYLAAIPDSTLSPTRFRQKPVLYIPAGVYRITRGLPAITFGGFRLRGDGATNTAIFFDSAADVPVFEIGVFETAPAGAYTGVGAGNFYGIRIHHASPGTAGTRKAQGIRSSGNGDLILEDVSVLGFKYGVNSPYGGDFNSYTRITVEYCDVGIYQGPSGQQFSGYHVHMFQCGEGLVLDRVSHLDWTMPIFNSCVIAGLVIDGADDTTRQMTAIPSGYKSLSLESKFVIRGAWFESAADNTTDLYVNDHFIRFDNTTTDAYRNIEIVDPYIVAGVGPTKNVASFMGFMGTGPMAQRVAIRRPVLSGTMTRWLTNPPIFAVTIENPRSVTTIPFSNTAAFGSYTVTDFTDSTTVAGERRKYLPILPASESVLATGTDFGYIMEAAAQVGIVRLGFRNAGGWIYRLGFDIQQRRVYLDDPSGAAAMCLTRSAAMPTSGSYGIGSFVYNTAPVVAAGKTLLGWQRLTTGSAHVAGTDWTPVYGTTT